MSKENRTFKNDFVKPDEQSSSSLENSAMARILVQASAIELAHIAERNRKCQKKIALLEKMKTAVFPGSFDPFTVGHASIVKRGLPMFDRIVIGVGVNDRKRSLYTPEQRVEVIRRLYAAEPRVKVVAYKDLTIDLARREGAGFILRGLRSVKDFEYERDIAAMNHRLGGVETVLLFTESQYAHISSSVVRELIAYGKDVSDFLPQP